MRAVREVLSSIYTPGARKDIRSIELNVLTDNLYLSLSHVIEVSLNIAGSSFFRVTDLKSLMNFVTGAVPVKLPSANSDRNDILFMSLPEYEFMDIFPMSYFPMLFSRTSSAMSMSPMRAPLFFRRLKLAVVRKLTLDMPRLSMFMAWRSAYPTCM